LSGQLLKQIITILLCVTVLSTLITYIVVCSKVRETYDRLLAQTARVYEVVINAYITHLQSFDAQVNLQTLWSQYDDLGIHDITGHRIHNDSKHAGFQVLTTNGKVILHSINAPIKPWKQQLRTGFSNSAGWRLYTLYNHQNKTWLILGQTLSARDETVQGLTLGLLLPLLLVLVFLFIVLPRTIVAGLYSLRQLARDVKKQSARNLKPIKLDTTSSELEYIVVALNGLIGRINTAIDREQRFVANAAHELRTPLTIIDLYSQSLLQKCHQQNDVHNIACNLQQSIIRAKRVVEQMLTLSRAEGDQVLQQFERLELTQLIREVIASIGITAVNKLQQLNFNADDCSIMIKGHRALLYSLFANLIDNAIRYTPEKGIITIQLIKKKDGIHFSVCDTGPGLNREQEKRVFDRFYRGESGSGDGAGLGLFIVQSIITHHHGTFSLKNRQNGEGLEAYIVLPLRAFEGITLDE